MLYGYGRVSTDLQENSASAQTEKLEAYLLEHGEGRCFVDIDVSGSIPLHLRPKGKLMWDAIQPGDTVVFCRVDRVFRSVADAANTLDKWRQMGVKIAILDLGIDVYSDAGEAFFSMLSVFAQFERRLIGKRIKECQAHQRLAGKPYGGRRPWGYRKIGSRHTAEFVIDSAERLLASRVADMRQAGMSWSKLATKLAIEGVQKTTRRRHARGYYSISDLWFLLKSKEAGYPIAMLESLQAVAP